MAVGVAVVVVALVDLATVVVVVVVVVEEIVTFLKPAMYPAGADLSWPEAVFNQHRPVLLPRAAPT